MSLRRLIPLIDRLARVTSGRPPGHSSGVLLISSGGIGDTILFSLMAPRFAALARPGESVDILVRRPAQAAAFCFPPGLTVFSIDYGAFLRRPIYRWKTQRDLAAKGYRLVIATDHLRHPLIDDVLVRACRAPESAALVARPWAKYDVLLARGRSLYKTLVTPSPGMVHRMVRWWELANALTGTSQPLPKVALPREILPAAKAHSGPFVLFHPFSAERVRMFSADIYRAIMAALPPTMRVVLSAGPGDLDRFPEFRCLLETGAHLADGSLEDKAALLQSARLAVCADTSMMHLAVACGAPTLCLASAAHVVDSVPYDPRMTPANVHFLLKHDMACAGCLGACSLPAEDGRYPCIARLEPSAITEKVLAMLDCHETAPS